MTAGYSGAPLARKLGYAPGMRVHHVGAPDRFSDLVGELPDGVTVLRGVADDVDREGLRHRRHLVGTEARGSQGAALTAAARQRRTPRLQ